MSQTRSKTQRINILVATDHGGYNGKLAGIGRNLSYTLPHINKKRFKIFLVILRDDGSLKARLAGTDITIFHLNRKKFDPFILLDLISIIKNENIHLLHLYQYACSDFGRLAGKIMHVPTILNLNDLNYNYPWYQRVADRLLKWSNDYAIAVSKAVQNSGAKVRTIDPNKIIVVHNAILTDHLTQLNPLECHELKKHWGIKTECQIVGTITRLHEVKRNDIFLKSAKIVLQTLPNTHFVLVGDGPLKDRLRESAKKLGISQNVTFTGHQKDVAGLLSIFDVKIIASRTEGFSLAMHEAMAMRKAIIATAVGGIKEVLKDDENGLIVPPKDPEAMAKKIIHLLQNEDDRKRLGTRAFNDRQKYNMASHSKQREAVYEKALALSQNLP